MDYKPVTGVWEITMGCNMRCKHCGSACMEALPDELSTEEALTLCDQIGDLGLRWITLSGGEPLTRKDWPLLAKRLRENNVIPNIITNGWILTEETLNLALDSGVGTFAISLDGLEETHDFMRKEGSYQRIMNALELMEKKGITAGVITTLNNRNIHELNKLYEILVEKGVKIWQLQIGLPMGTFAENNHMLLSPEQIDDVIDFIYTSVNDDRIDIYPADCLGYYNVKEIAARTKSNNASNLVVWKGCNAGKRSFGLLHNGDVLGCTSIRDRQYIEGNIRQTPLREIWENTENFSWNRNMKKEQLKGLCTKCAYGDTCLGGCPNTRLTMHGDIYAENNYCSYNVSMQKTLKQINGIENIDQLVSAGRSFVQNNELQLAQMVFEKVLQADPDNTEVLDHYGYASFMLGNYEDAKRANEKVLNKTPDSIYAHKGLGLTLCKLGEHDKGIELLKKSSKMTTGTYMDPYHDLIITLVENRRGPEAIEAFKDAEEKCPGFIQQNSQLYRMAAESGAQ